MANNNNALLLAGLALAGYFLYSQSNHAAPADDVPTDNIPTDNSNSMVIPASAIPATKTYSYPVVYLKYHPDVKILQSVLGVKADGIIGPMTLKAIQKYFPVYTSRLRFGTPSDLMTLISLIKAKKSSAALRGVVS